MKTSRIFSIAILCLTMLCGCGGQQTEKDVQAADSTALRIAVLPTVDCLPFYVAVDCGLYDSLGLSVQLLTFDAAMDADTAFANGWADILVSDLIKTTWWSERGDSIHTLFAADLRLSLITTASSRIHAVSSLREKIVGITRHSSTDFTADKILETASLEPQELNRPQINNLPLRASMTNLQQYDGAVLPEPFASLCVASKGYRLCSSDSIGTTSQMLTLITSDTLYQQRSRELDLLQTAFNLAVDRINKTSGKDAPRLLSLLPLENAVPDSIACIAVLHHATQPTDSAVSQARQWVRDRVMVTW